MWEDRVKKINLQERSDLVVIPYPCVKIRKIVFERLRVNPKVLNSEPSRLYTGPSRSPCFHLLLDPCSLLLKPDLNLLLHHALSCLVFIFAFTLSSA